MSDISPAIVVFLMTCTMLTGASVTMAQETAGRALLSNSANTTQPEFLTGPVPDAGQRSTAGPLRSATTVPLTGARADISDQSGTSATASTSMRVYPKPDAAPLVIQDTPLQTDTWQEEYSGHIDEVLTGGTSRSQHETIGDWWRRRLPQFEFATVEPRRLKASAQHFVHKHTLPPEHEYDVDVYDQRPISVASSQAETTVRPPAATTDRTDIRQIRPTLGYAMRNIDAGQLPEGFNAKLDQGDYIARQSSPAVLQWAPTNLYHYPLYFEDPALERYGHTYHPVVQPFASAGRFATQLVGIPYQMTLHPVHSREYALGYYRPGECAPKKHYQIPFNEEAAIMQAAAMAGFFLIFP